MSPLWRIFRGRLQMNIKQKFSRRKFVSSAVSASAISVLPGAQKLLREFSAPIGMPAPEQNSVALTTNPPWRDQAILNLTKSPHAKLRNVPVHAVTIESGFWSPRRETNVNSSISFHGQTPGSQRPHGQFPPANRKEQRAATRSGLLRFGHLQMDRSGRLRAAIRR